MPEVFAESTVAASRTPYLRESVNVVLGTGLPVGHAAKAGNATHPIEAHP